MADLSVYEKVTPLFKLKQLAQKEQFAIDQLKQEQALKIQKANELDVSKLGEQAFVKAAMGEALSPQEMAAAQYIDAKSALPVYNPVTGALEQKPSISSRMGLGVQAQPNRNPPTLPKDIVQNEPLTDLDIRFQQEMAKAKGNPKLQQQLTSAYSKSKTEFTEGQSNAATYADRMREAENILTTPAIQQAGLSMSERIKSSVPLVSNYIISPEKRQLDQAQRNFINAVLRRESGAVISEQEFENARLQYFPQPGDDEQTLANKAVNRELALQGLSRSAGAAYMPKTNKLEEKFRNEKNKGVVDYSEYFK
jgi:hypothetical protein